MINEGRGKVLRDHGIRTIEDLLWHLPFRYEDWRQTRKISQVKDGDRVTVHGTVMRSHLQVTPRLRPLERTG